MSLLVSQQRVTIARATVKRVPMHFRKISFCTVRAPAFLCILRRTPGSTGSRLPNIPLWHHYGPTSVLTGVMCCWHINLALRVFVFMIIVSLTFSSAIFVTFYRWQRCPLRLFCLTLIHHACYDIRLNYITYLQFRHTISNRLQKVN